MGNFRFLDWPVYSSSQQLLSAVIEIAKTLPTSYRIEIGSQIVRSSLSVCLNIAEGSGKSSPRELNRFLDISLGSAYETLAGLDALRRNALLSEDAFDSLQTHIDSICRQLGGLRKKTSARLKDLG